MAIILNDSLKVEAPRPTDARYGPYNSTAEALLAIPAYARHSGLTLGVKVGPQAEVVEYWFNSGTLDSDLVEKDSTISTLSDLEDVDLSTDPPEDGQGLIYDSTLEKWIPGESGSGDSYWVQNDFGIHTLENVGINKETPSVKLDIGNQIPVGESWISTLLSNGTNSQFAERYTCSTVNNQGQVFVASFGEGRKFSIHMFSQEGEHLESETFSIEEFEIDTQTVYYAAPKKIAIDPEATDLTGFKVIQLVFYPLDGPDTALPLGSAIFFPSGLLASLLIPPQGYSLRDIELTEDLSLVGTALRFVSGVPELVIFSYLDLLLNIGSPPDWVKSYPLTGLIPQGTELDGSTSFPSSLKISQTGDIVTLLNLIFPTYDEQTEEFGVVTSSLLLKFDSTGIEQWNLNFPSSINTTAGSGNLDIFSSFSLSSNGFITLAGTLVSTLGGTSEGAEALIRVSPSGAIVWSKKYQETTINDLNSLALFTSILEGSGGNLFIINSQTTVGGTSESDEFFLSIAEFSSSGEPTSSVNLTSNFNSPLVPIWGGFSLLAITTSPAQFEDGFIFLTNTSGLPGQSTLQSCQVLKLFSPVEDLQSFGELYRVLRSEALVPENTTLTPEILSLSPQIPNDFAINYFSEDPPQVSEDQTTEFSFRLDGFEDPILSKVDGSSEFNLVSTDQLFVNQVPIKASIEDNNLNWGAGAGGFETPNPGTNNIFLGNFSGPRTGSQGSGNIYIGNFSGAVIENGTFQFDGNIVIGNNSYYPAGSEGGLLIGNSSGNWIYGDRNYNISLGSEYTEEKLNVGGNISINETTIYGSQTVIVEEFSPVNIHADLTADAIRSIEYTIQVETAGGESQISKLMCLHNGSETFVSQFGAVYTSVELAVFQVFLDEGTVILEANPLVESVSRYSFRFEAIRIPTIS